MKSLKSLESKEFACEADALSAAADFEKTLNYHLLSELEIVTKPHYQRRGRPRPGDVDEVPEGYLVTILIISKQL